MVQAQAAKCSRAHTCPHRHPLTTLFPSPQVEKRQVSAAPVTRARLRRISYRGPRRPGPVSQHLGGEEGGAQVSPRRGEAQAGTRWPGTRPGGGHLRPAWPPGSPGWVLSVPSVFREGDSATLSRVEKPCETRNRARKRGRGGIALSQGRGGCPLRSDLEPTGPHPQPPGIRRQEGSAALQPQCRGHATRRLKRLREEGAPCGSRGSIPLLPLRLPSPPARTPVKVGALAPRRRGTRAGCSPRSQSWREGAAETARAASPFSPAREGTSISPEKPLP